MNNHESSPDKKAAKFIALGGFFAVSGSAGSVYEALGSDYVQAAGLGILAVAGAVVSIYEGTKMAAQHWVRTHHDELKYDRTNETSDD